tara:strand:- start:318 stop:2132 length:1815 start_codon:yes stop_codon:yes gene_type:complete
VYKNKNCGEPNSKDIGSEVIVAGWVNKRRDHGNLIFIDLRDKSGVLQVVFNPEVSSDAHDLASNLRSEWVVQIKGVIVKRISGAENDSISTGSVELQANEIKILNKSKTPPFEISDEIEIDDQTRLAYRFIDLRRPKMQKLFTLRHKITKLIWDYLSDRDFTHIETPILLKSTPEGARDYVVPSRIHPGKFYALPQSPQQLKQILMVSGFDRYFQIARCFRDEDLRADRQPEHTQLDLEMSFVHQDDVMLLVEGLYKHITYEILGNNYKQNNKDFVRLSYEESIERFGTDKPDLRFGMELVTISEELKNTESNVFNHVLNQGGVIRGIVAPGAGDYDRKKTDELIDLAKSSGASGLVYILFDNDFVSIENIKDENYKSPLKKFLNVDVVKGLAKKMSAKPGDMILIVADQENKVNTVLSNLRNFLGEKLNLYDQKEIMFAWVYDFPLFEWDEDLKKWEPAHHVFSSPKTEHLDFLISDPGKVHADLFDLVCNGMEMGSGSIRIHDPNIQKKVFSIIGYKEEEIDDRFGQLIKAFSYGAPPHGGMGLGLDRFIATLAGEKAIREVIAFPKTQSAQDPLFDSPNKISNQQLEELFINLNLPDEEEA